MTLLVWKAQALSSALVSRWNSHKTTHFPIKTELPKMAYIFCLAFKTLWISRTTCWNRGRDNSVIFILSRLPLRKGGDLGMTSPTENETTNLVLLFKSTNSYPKGWCNLDPNPNPKRKFPALLPGSFLLSHWRKAEKQINPRHLACSLIYNTENLLHFSTA